MLPSYATQVINYNPIIQQALLDVARWAEQGTGRIVRAELCLGERANLYAVGPKGNAAVLECPPVTYTDIDLSQAEYSADGEQVAFDIPVKYGDVGTYFPAIRVTSSRNGQNETFTQIQNLDRVDILVNSAGGTGAHGSLDEEFSTENLKHTLDMDFTSTFNCIKYTYPRMEATGGGSIINIASLAALRARGPICYSAAKGAIQSLSRNLALRFGKMGIRVNTIYPGFIVTEMTDKIFEMPELEKKMRSESVLGLLGEIDDIAYCALYLASNEAKFVTGQDFVIDGGTIIK